MSYNSFLIMFSLIARLKKQKEEERERHKQNEETAKIYADYVKSFDGSSSNTTPRFVKADSCDPSAGVANPSINEVFSSSTENDNDVSSYQINDPSLAYLSQIGGENPDVFKKKEPSGKIREIDTFIEEIKEKQRILNERKELERQHFNTSDHEKYKLNQNTSIINALSTTKVYGDVSTEICISNLPSNINEDILRSYFTKYGPMDAVKIIHQGNSEHRPTICGIVSFYNRRQAERAKDEMEGVPILGIPCKIRWAKKVSETELESSNNTSKQSYEVTELDFSKLTNLDVKIPNNTKKMRIIDIMAKYVAEYGQEFEQMIMAKESPNGLFAFLFERFSPEHIYYRWRVYSLIQGDSLDKWEIKPFKIFKFGLTYNPPSNFNHDKTLKTSSSVSHSRINQSGRCPLSAEKREKLESLLKTSTSSRSDICNAMVYIINHSESAYEITDILVSHILESSDINAKIIRFYILSDVLYNSSSSRQFAWVYRSSIEKRIPEVFHHIKQFKKKSNSKIAGQQLMDCAIKILRIWEEWTIYSQMFTKGLEVTLLGDDSDSFVPAPEFSTFKHLITPNDGKPLVYFNILSKIPLEWRQMTYVFFQFWNSVVQKYLTMNIKDLKTLSVQRGLLITPSDRESLVVRLILYDIYWFEKLESGKIPEEPDISVNQGDDLASVEQWELVSEPQFVDNPNGSAEISDAHTDNIEDASIPQNLEETSDVSDEQVNVENTEDAESNDDIFA